MWDWKDKNVLVTGGAGGIGSALTEALLRLPVRVVRVFDVDEYGLFLLKKRLSDPRLRFLLGDVRDRERVKLALAGVDVVYHLSAAKNMEITEYNCPETVRTNVDGTVNMVECSFEAKPERFIFCSSDKAVEPSSLYGATKLLGEKIVLWGNSVSDDTLFGVVRFGNVIESRGNVFDVWRRQAEAGEALSLTDPRMTRLFLHIEEAVSLLLKSCELMEGGEIFLPEAKQVNIMEMAKETGSEVRIIGARRGEKLEEKLYTPSEAERMEKIGDMYVIKRAMRG